MVAKGQLNPVVRDGSVEEGFVDKEFTCVTTLLTGTKRVQRWV